MRGRNEAAAWVLGAGGVTLSLAGLALLASQRAGTRAGASREPWSQRRMLAMRRAIKTQQAMDPEP
jgi:hypothetical protein